MCKRVRTGARSSLVRYRGVKLQHTSGDSGRGHQMRVILKSKQQASKDKPAAAAFLEAARYGLSIAKEGIEKERKGELHWHDPYGIREALLYSFRNACIAFGASKHSYAHWLKIECCKFQRNPHASFRAAARKLGQVTHEDWNMIVSRDVASVQIPSDVVNSTNISQNVGSTIKDSCIMFADGSGDGIPRLGFGTALFAKECFCNGSGRCCQACFEIRSTVHAAVVSATKNGYRHFDCAQCYNNEEVIGAALKASGVPRRELFFASKLSSWSDYGVVATRALVKKQLRKLQTSYLDLYYLHDDIDDFRKERTAWRALEGLHEEGLIKHLGLSNYRIDGIKRIMSYAHVQPSVLQIKYDVYHPGYQWAGEGVDNVVGFARSKGIAVVGYGSFSGWPSLLRAREDPHIREVAERYGRTPEQIILRHGLQKDLALIPASKTVGNIALNAQVFDFSLTATDVAYLDGLASLVAFPPISWLRSSSSELEMLES